MSEPAGRVVDAALHLLDRQLVDVDGGLAGKVDDLELEVPADGPPYVTAILAGPGALGLRLGGRLGTWIASVHRRLHPQENAGPARVPFAAVKRVESAVELSLSRADLDLDRAEDWVRRHVIGKIPGAGHAPE